MNKGTSLLVLGVVLVAVTIPVLAWRRTAIAESGATEQLDRLHAMQAKAEELIRLRASAPYWSNTKPDHAGLAERLTAALASRGLPASCLASLSPSAEPLRTADSSLNLVARRASLTLTALTLPQVGSFVDAWRTREPSWTVAAIDLTPESVNAPTPGADLPLRATLTLESLAAESAEKN